MSLAGGLGHSNLSPPSRKILYTFGNLYFKIELANQLLHRSELFASQNLKVDTSFVFVEPRFL